MQPNENCHNLNYWLAIFNMSYELCFGSLAFVALTNNRLLPLWLWHSLYVQAILRQSHSFPACDAQPTGSADWFLHGKQGRLKKKKKKSKKRLLNNNPSQKKGDYKPHTWRDIRLNQGLFFRGYGIYLQGPHLLGTVMVVSIQIFGEASLSLLFIYFWHDSLLPLNFHIFDKTTQTKSVLDVLRVKWTRRMDFIWFYSRFVWFLSLIARVTGLYSHATF